MAICLTRAEYWMLGAAFEYPVAIADLPSGIAAMDANIPDHLVTDEELCGALTLLSAQEWIVGCDAVGERNLALTRDQIKVELSRWERRCHQQTPSYFPCDVRATCYKLTPAGGAAWEEFTRPPWDRYIEGIGVYRDLDLAGEAMTGYAVPQCQYKIRRYLGLLPLMGCHFDASSVAWDTLSPWQITYWKTLPSAHRVQFRFSEKPQFGPSSSSGDEGAALRSAAWHAAVELRRWHAWPAH